VIKGIVETIPSLCKRCYSCVRECPAIAIKVEGGQAVVMTDRCIACGHCVTVCSQHAKKIQSDIEKVREILKTDEKKVMIVAPSFPASFPDSYSKIPSAIRKLGFDYVCETAFGADLISPHYLEMVENEEEKVIISSACPAIYNYIEKYFQELVPRLAKVVSPMIALGRYLRNSLGNNIKIVFAGPCIAKKFEYQDEEVANIIDAVLTFEELKALFSENRINVEEQAVSDFDPPHSYMGKAFPLSGGLLKSADISGDLLEKKVLVVEGKQKIESLLNELADGVINAKFIDILFCEGCISGPGIDSDLNFYSRREKVIDYIKEKNNKIDKQVWRSNIFNSRDLDLTRQFSYKNKRIETPSEERIREILAQTNKFSKEDELNCGSCGYRTCRDYAVAIAKGLAENDMCLPYLIDKLERAYKELQETQEQLQSAEKLASIGQLAAGVAHELNNPLGSILIFTDLLKQQISERIKDKQTLEDLDLIAEETKRCRNIVSNLLNFARQSKLTISKVDIYDIISNVIRTLSIKPENSKVKFSIITETDNAIIDGDEEQLKQVFLNIITNAAEAVEDTDIKEVTVTINKTEYNLIIVVYDTGIGIPKENFSKLFTPFFTTKKIGKGTGLGLPISYGIVKMHRGSIEFKSEVGKGTQCIVKLPIKLNSFQ
jgi:signal transduction histidine kinase/iron only hydrogenase large subunit-like protein